MAIQIIDGFQVNTALPIDNRIVASGSTARNAIPYKYEGLRVFDTSDGIPYVWLNGAWISENATGVVASGTTTNYIPKLTGSNIVGDSIIYQDGSNNIGVATTTPTAKVDVNGSFKANSITTTDGSGIQQLNATNATSGTLPLVRLQGAASTGQIIVAGVTTPSWTNQSQLSVGTASRSLTASAVNVTSTIPSGSTLYLPFVNNASSSTSYIDTDYLYNKDFDYLKIPTIVLGEGSGATISSGNSVISQQSTSVSGNNNSPFPTIGSIKVPNNSGVYLKVTFNGRLYNYSGNFAHRCNIIEAYYTVSSSGVISLVGSEVAGFSASQVSMSYSVDAGIIDIATSNTISFKQSCTGTGAFIFTSIAKYEATVRGV